jgi:hypothetical protein
VGVVVNSSNAVLVGGWLVADPRRLNTVYLNAAPDYSDLTAHTSRYVARSDDAGLTWTLVTTPTMMPALTTFAVSSDPHVGAVLVGQTLDKGVPADRRWLSINEGHTWATTNCPGDVAGVCPRFTVDNVFGAGSSYGFVRNGVYRFQGGHPATQKLTLSSPLPFRTDQLFAVGAGTHAGDPIYLLGRGGHGQVHGLLYRSLDEGKSWQMMSLILLAHLTPACPPPLLPNPCENSA